MIYFSPHMKPWRHIATSLLSAIILIQSASLLLIDTSFKANHDYIAAVLCVNRNKPQMHCDGKCQLKKELTTEQEKESSQKSLMPVSLLLFFDEPPVVTHCYASPADLSFPAAEFQLPQGFCTTNERPPTA